MMDMTDYAKDTLKRCPRCKKMYTGWPALSRADNRTFICADCGREEAHLGMVRPEGRKKRQSGKR